MKKDHDTELKSSEGARAEPLHSYILLRSDLPLPAQLAQCAHAAQESAFLLGAAPPEPIHVVILACPNERALLHAAERLARKGFDPGLFYEPDWPRGPTALYLKPQRRSAKLRAAMNVYALWVEPSAAPHSVPPFRMEPTDNPLNPTVVIDPGAETLARMAYLLGKLGLELSDCADSLRRQLEGAGLPTDTLDWLERLAELVDVADGPEGWSRRCEETKSGYARFRGYLAEPHGGDCTSLPGSCVRCWAELTLGIDSAPASKIEGYRLHMEQAQKYRVAKAHEAPLSPAVLA